MPDGQSRPLDWLIKSPDYYPQILGTLVGASGVNIQLWQVVDGQNTSVSEVDSKISSQSKTRVLSIESDLNGFCKFINSEA